MSTTEATQNHRPTTPDQDPDPLTVAAASAATLETALRSHVPAWAHWQPRTLCDTHSHAQALQTLASGNDVDVLVVDEAGRKVNLDATIGWVIRWTTPAGHWAIGFSAAGDDEYRFQASGPDDLRWGTVGTATATAEQVIARLIALDMFPAPGPASA